VASHLGKMFASLVGFSTSSSIEGEEEESKSAALITSMISREGEEVQLRDGVETADAESAQQWLGRLEKQMRKSLAHLMLEAVLALKQLKPQEEQAEAQQKLQEWIAAFPAQVVILAQQIEWSQATKEALTSKGASEKLREVQALLEGRVQVRS